MGNCCGTEIKSISGYIQDDTQIEEKSDIYNPSFSSLFNALRKTSELVVLQPNNRGSSPLLPSTMAIDFDTAKPNYIKTLLNFKKVILIGHFQTYRTTIIKTIKEVANVSRFYIINDSICSKFLQEFPIFRAQTWQKNKLEVKDIPIMVIDSRDFVDCSDQVKLYIHSASRKDMKKYNLLGISKENIIQECTSNTQATAVQYYLKQLNKNGSKSIVLLHSQKLDSDVLVQVLVSYLKEQFKIPPPYAKVYLMRSLPKTNMRVETEVPEEKLQASSLQEYSNQTTDQFKHLFSKLEDQAGMQKANRACQLLTTLTTNIYSHSSDDEMYRKVRRTTRQISQLSKYKAFVQLLQKLGWKEQKQFWVNSVQSKYLKIFRTDLDVGFKQFKAESS